MSFNPHRPATGPTRVIAACAALLATVWLLSTQHAFGQTVSSSADTTTTEKQGEFSRVIIISEATSTREPSSINTGRSIFSGQLSTPAKSRTPARANTAAKSTAADTAQPTVTAQVTTPAGSTATDTAQPILIAQASTPAQANAPARSTGADTAQPAPAVQASTTVRPTVNAQGRLQPRYQITQEQLHDQLPVQSREFGLPQVGTSTKSILVGFGYVHHRYEARFDGISNIQGRTEDLGLSVGFRNTESLYVSPRFPLMIGFSVGLGSYINFAPTFTVERVNEGPAGANIAKFRNAGNVSSFSQTFNAGVTFSTGNSLLITELTIGPAINLLVHSLTTEGTTPVKASMTLGAGVQGDLAWRFRISPMISIPINATIGIYPLNLDSFFSDVDYRTQLVLIAAAQIGVTFTY